MRFSYNLPQQEKNQEIDSQFLPSIAYTVFMRKGNDIDNFDLQGIYCRRIPQILKMKTELLGRFNSKLVIPVVSGEESGHYMEMKSTEFWGQEAFIPRYESCDYYIGGALSLDGGALEIRIYSHTDDKIIYVREYIGSIEDFFDFTVDFIRDMLAFFELAVDEEIMRRIGQRPVENTKSFNSLIMALEYDPRIIVEQADKSKYLEHLFDALKEDPRSQDISHLLIGQAQIEYISGNTDIAWQIVSIILNYRPFDEKAHLLKIRIQVENRELEEAVSTLAELSKNNDKIKEIPFILGKDLMETGLVKPALELFDKALELGYEDPSLFDYYCYLLIYNKELHKALKLLESAMQKFPHREETLLYTAQVLTELGKLEEADKIYRDAMTLYPKSAKVLSSRAIFHTYTGQLRQTEELINTALDISPEDQLINLEAAKILSFLGKDADAMRLSRTSIDLAPDTRIAEEARDFLSRISAGISVEEQLKNREMFIEALRSIDDNDNPHTIKLLESVTKKEPLFWNAWFVMGIACRRRGRLDEALDALSKVEDLFRDQVSLHHEIARCLMAKEQFQKAFPHMLYSFQRRPQDPPIMANMGLVYFFLGKYQEAETLLIQAQKMDPVNLDLKPFLNRLDMIKKRKQKRGSNGGAIEE